MRKQNYKCSTCQRRQEIKKRKRIKLEKGDKWKVQNKKKGINSHLMYIQSLIKKGRFSPFTY